MRVEILLSDQVVNTQLIRLESLGSQSTVRDLKRAALAAALRDGAISIPQSLQATFRVFDGAGKPFSDPAEPARHSLV